LASEWGEDDIAAAIAEDWLWDAPRQGWLLFSLLTAK
jgi:hypothetical protein